MEFESFGEKFVGVTGDWSGLGERGQMSVAGSHEGSGMAPLVAQLLVGFGAQVPIGISRQVFLKGGLPGYQVLLPGPCYSPGSS